MHEAFAGQVLANFTAMGSDAFAAASRAGFSGAASVLRPASLARDVRTVGGDWRDDWLLVRVRGFAQCPNQISAHGQCGRVVVEK